MTFGKDGKLVISKSQVAAALALAAVIWGGGIAVGRSTSEAQAKVIPVATSSVVPVPGVVERELGVTGEQVKNLAASMDSLQRGLGETNKSLSETNRQVSELNGRLKYLEGRADIKAKKD